MESSSSVLKLEDVCAGYGGAQVLFDINLEINIGGSLALLGVNGAGKTTLLRVLSGAVKLSSGRIYVNGMIIRRTTPLTMSGLGVVHVPEGRGLFARLTVAENVAIGCRGASRRESLRQADEVLQLFPRLDGRYGQLVGFLSGGEQQMVALARALVAKPRLLLLDEPTLGLAPKLRSEVLKMVVDLKETLDGVLIVEQNADEVLGVVDQCAVMRSGRIVLEGASEKMQERYVEVREAYLG